MAVIITIYLLMAAIFIPVGLVTLHTSRGVVECVNRCDLDCVPDAVKTNKLQYIKNISIPKNCSCFLKNGVLYTDDEDRNITVLDVNSGKVAYCIEDAHSARLKGIVVLTRNSGTASDDDPYLGASSSSGGVIRVWDVRMAMMESRTHGLRLIQSQG